MVLWNALSGGLMVKFTSAAPEETLDRIVKSGIPVLRVIQKNDLTYEILIRRTDLTALSYLIRRQGDHLEIVGKHGLYWILPGFSHRPVLVAAFLFLILVSCCLPARIFFVTVEGNSTIPDRQILTAAENCGIGFGASRREVRSERVKNKLLSAVPKLQWAGVNTSGCTAVISVRERVPEEPETEKNVVSNLIADRDGYILSTTVTSGTAQVFPGQAVVKGQLLISGYTDCGFCIRATRAEGEILAQTNRDLTVIMPERYLFPSVNSGVRYKISLLLGKKRINLWKDSRISDAGCGRMYEEYYVSLPGGFRLPAAICVDRYLDYQLQDAVIPEADAQKQLQEFSDRYLLGQMVAGQILQKKQKLSSSAGQYRLESSYVCTEHMGKAQREQIGVINGKRN